MVHHHRVTVSGFTLGIILLLCGVGLASKAEAQNFQKVPIILRASELLPRELLSGPNYTVKETAKNGNASHSVSMKCSRTENQ